MIEKWLQEEEIRRVLSLPTTFPVLEKLGPQVEQAVRYGLVPMIGQPKADELTTWFANGRPATNGALATLYDEVKLYLIYAAWASYHIDGAAEYTKTGPVIKENDNSTPISSTMRAEIKVKYQRFADIHAANIQRLTTETGHCRDIAPYGTRINISRASGKATNRFNRPYGDL